MSPAIIIGFLLGFYLVKESLKVSALNAQIEELKNEIKRLKNSDWEPL
jgi:hypothetical protein